MHSKYLDMIKKEVGASFVAIERNKDMYAIKVIKNGEFSYFELVGSPQYATPQSYVSILQKIKKHYGQV